MRVVVVGAGLGGMAAATRLAARGHAVEVFEKEQAPGGKAGSFERGGYRFDTGPTLLTMPEVFRDLFAAAGERLEDHVSLEPVDPLCTYRYDDGTVLPAWRDPERFAVEAGRTTSDPAQAVRAYLRHARGLFEAAAPFFLGRSLHEPSSWLTPRLLPLLPRLARLDGFRTLHAAHASFFRDPRLVQLFDRFATYNGSDPYRAPATLALISHVEHGMGGYAVRAGLSALAEAVRGCAERRGVRFHFGTPVEEILVEPGRGQGIADGVGAGTTAVSGRAVGGRVVGVAAGGETVPADVVISNVDVLTTWHRLVQVAGGADAPEARRVERSEASTSGLLFLWGVTRRFPEVGVNTILFPARYEEEFADLFGRRAVPADPTVYIHVSARVRPSDAPPGCENWYVLVNAPPDHGQDWSAETALARKRVLERIRRSLGHDIEPLIAIEETLNPRDFEVRTGSWHGSLYGIASNTAFSAFLRHRNRLPRIKGLYFCGGSAHPGGGTPVVTLSGKITAELVLRHASGYPGPR